MDYPRRFPCILLMLFFGLLSPTLAQQQPIRVVVVHPMLSDSSLLSYTGAYSAVDQQLRKLSHPPREAQRLFETVINSTIFSLANRVNSEMMGYVEQFGDTKAMDETAYDSLIQHWLETTYQSPDVIVTLNLESQGQKAPLLTLTRHSVPLALLANDTTPSPFSYDFIDAVLLVSDKTIEQVEVSGDGWKGGLHYALQALFPEANTPAQIALQVQPRPLAQRVRATDTLRIAAQVQDPDSPPEAWSYKWTVNGQEQPFATEPELELLPVSCDTVYDITLDFSDGIVDSPTRSLTLTALARPDSAHRFTSVRLVKTWAYDRWSWWMELDDFLDYVPAYHQGQNQPPQLSLSSVEGAVPVLYGELATLSSHSTDYIFDRSPVRQRIHTRYLREQKLAGTMPNRALFVYWGHMPKNPLIGSDSVVSWYYIPHNFAPDVHHYQLAYVPNREGLSFTPQRTTLSTVQTKQLFGVHSLYWLGRLPEYLWDTTRTFGAAYQTPGLAFSYQRELFLFDQGLGLFAGANVKILYWVPTEGGRNMMSTVIPQATFRAHYPYRRFTNLYTRLALGAAVGYQQGRWNGETAHYAPFELQTSLQFFVAYLLEAGLSFGWGTSQDFYDGTDNGYIYFSGDIAFMLP